MDARYFAAAVAIFATPLFAAPQKVHESVSVELAPAAIKLRVGDPLRLRVVVHNNGRKPREVHAALSTETGTVRFEMAPDAADGFRPVNTRGGGATCAVPKAWKLEPGQTKVLYSILFAQGDDLVFREAGRCRVRACVNLDSAADGHAAWLYSEAVTLDVAATPERELALIRRSLPDLDRAIGDPFMRSSPKLGEVPDIAENFADSELRRTLRWVRSLLALSALDDPPRRLRTGEHLDKARQDMDSVSADILGFLLAREYAAKEEWDSAAEVLRSVKALSAPHRALRNKVESRRREQLRRNGGFARRRGRKGDRKTGQRLCW